MNGGFPSLGECETPGKSPYEDGWKVVLEIEDDNAVDDVPNDHASIMKGYETKNAYFVGGEKLKSLEYHKVQLCLGYRATSDQCPRVKCYNIENRWISASANWHLLKTIQPAGFTRYMSMAIACLAGADYCRHDYLILDHTQWRLPIGHAADPAPMDTYGNAKTGDIVWSCLGQVNVVAIPGYQRSWRFGRDGFAANFDKNDEIYMTNNACKNKERMPTAVATDRMDYMNLFQIRVKAMPNYGFPMLGNCKTPEKSPYQDDGWKTVFELEDDNNVDDVPDNANDIFNGFETKNAYFVGAQTLSSITYTKAQFCAGYRATTDGCPRVKCYDIPEDWLDEAYIPGKTKRVVPKLMSSKIVQLAGGEGANYITKKGSSPLYITPMKQWRFPIGHPADPAPMDTYGNAETGDMVFFCGPVTYDGHLHTAFGNGWTFWWRGWSGIYNKAKRDSKIKLENDELRMGHGGPDECNNKAHMPKAVADDGMQYMNLFQIRVK